MKKRLLLLFIVFIISFYSKADDFDLSSQFILKKDLEIGNEDKDDYLFAEVFDLEVDKDFSIYTLDRITESIKKFSSKGKFIKTIGRKGEGPGEIRDYQTLTMSLNSAGDLIVLERLSRRVHIFNSNGDFIKSFDTFPGCRGIAADENDRIIILGAYKDKIFHVYDKNGDFIHSFGDLFTLPDEYKRYKRPGWRVSFRFFYSKASGEFYICHPFKYEIWAFTPDSSRKIISRQSDFFSPFYNMEKSGKRRKIRSTFPIFAYKDLLFVTLGVDVQNGQYVMEIYRNFKYQGYIPVKGHLKAVDKKGRLYFSEPERVIRYTFLYKHK